MELTEALRPTFGLLENVEGLPYAYGHGHLASPE